MSNNNKSNNKSLTKSLLFIAFPVIMTLFGIIHAIQNDRLGEVEAKSVSIELFNAKHESDQANEERICRIEQELIKQGKSVSKIEAMLEILMERTK